MKIVAKFMWFFFLLAILTLSMAACVDRGAIPITLQSVPVIPVSMAGFGNTVSSVATFEDTLARLPLPRQNIEGDKVVLGGTFNLAHGETLKGNLIVIGGTATIEEDSVVEKDVMVMGGTISVSGRIEGSVNIVGGLVTLSKSAAVGGDVNALGGNLLRDEGAQVNGAVNTDVPGMFPFVLPGRIEIPNLGGWFPIQPGDLRIPRFNIHVNPFWDGLLLLFRSFLWAVIAVLVVIFLPKNSERVAGVISSQPLIAGGLGCMTVIIAPLILALLAITICGIPISVIGAIILLAAWGYGIIVVGMEVGTRLAQLVKQDWALPVSASIGTFILTLVINSIGAFIACIGWLAPALVGVVGLGAVLLTRFGSQHYPPENHSLSETMVEPPVIEPPVTEPPVIEPKPSETSAILQETKEESEPTQKRRPRKKIVNN